MSGEPTGQNGRSVCSLQSALYGVVALVLASLVCTGMYISGWTRPDKDFRFTDLTICNQGEGASPLTTTSNPSIPGPLSPPLACRVLLLPHILISGRPARPFALRPAPLRSRAGVPPRPLPPTPPTNAGLWPTAPDVPEFFDTNADEVGTVGQAPTPFVYPMLAPTADPSRSRPTAGPSRSRSRPTEDEWSQYVLY